MEREDVSEKWHLSRELKESEQISGSRVDNTERRKASAKALRQEYEWHIVETSKHVSIATAEHLSRGGTRSG